MSNVSRRRYLRLLGAVAAGGVAGCLNEQSDGTATAGGDGRLGAGETGERTPTATWTASGVTDEAGSAESSETATPEETTGAAETASGATRTRVGPTEQPVRCRGDPVSAERTVVDEPGYEDDMRYFSSNSTVRIVATRNADGPVSYESVPFAEWADWESGEAATERVRAVTADRLDTDEFGSGYGDGPASAETDQVVWVSVSTRDTDDGTVTPTVSLPALADAAPRSVEVTVSLEGDERSKTLPVYARHRISAFP